MSEKGYLDKSTEDLCGGRLLAFRLVGAGGIAVTLACPTVHMSQTATGRPLRKGLFQDSEASVLSV